MRLTSGRLWPIAPYARAAMRYMRWARAYEDNVHEVNKLEFSSLREMDGSTDRRSGGPILSVCRA